MRRIIGWIALAIAALVSLSGRAEADNVTGSGLLAACDADDVTKHAFCLGYIGGVADDLAARGALPLKICIPDTATTAQLVGITIRFLQQNPALGDQSGVTNVLAAMEKAFPCY